MEVRRIWFCNCTGKPMEVSYEEPSDPELPADPVCPRCGASPSSDPRRTMSYKDVTDWED